VTAMWTKPQSDDPKRDWRCPTCSLILPVLTAYLNNKTGVCTDAVFWSTAGFHCFVCVA
jgi:hypothetical protein